MSNPTMIPADKLLERLTRAHRSRRDDASKRPGRRRQLTDEAQGLDAAIRIVTQLLDEQGKGAA